MGTTNPLASLFGPNPFRALQDHIRVVIRCVDQIPPLFEALAQQDRDRIKQIKLKIFELEEEADQIKNKLRQQLPRGLFLPVNRRDLLEVLDMQDSIADMAQDIAGLLYERPMQIPDPMVEPLLDYVRKCVSVCHLCAKVIEELDELLEIGFRGRQVSKVEQMITELNSVEDETDDMGITLGRLLFKHEDEIAPVSVVFWYQLLQWIGDLADYAEKAGNRLRLLVAR